MELAKREDANPTVALIALSFNHGRYLSQLFSSIQANIDYIGELLFIDNGSKDDSIAQMRTFLSECPKRVVTHLFTNPAGTRVTVAVNEALRSASCEFIAVTAADDYLLDQRFEAQLRAFRAQPSLQFCYSNGWMCDEHGVLTQTPVHGPTTLAILKSRPQDIAGQLFFPVPTIFTQCALFRRDALREVGGWDEDLIIDDWPLNLKLFSRFAESYCFISGYVCAYRRHPRNASKRRFRQYIGQKQVLSKYARGRDATQGFAALYATQALASLKRRQWHRMRVFGVASAAVRPGLRFAIRWVGREIARRLYANRIR